MKSNQLKTFWFHELPEQIIGDVIVVDAWAASLNICILLAKKPTHLIVVNEQDLLKVKSFYSGAILVGESDILVPRRFQASNLPGDIDQVPAQDKTILWMSVNGSKVIEKAMKIIQNGQVFIGSTGNVKALSRRFSKKLNSLNIIISGSRGKEVKEDKLCGKLIEKAILNLPINWKSEVEQIMEAVKKTYPPFNWEKDINLIPDYLNRFLIVPKIIHNRNGFLEAIA